jgi:hypothetical protein
MAFLLDITGSAIIASMVLLSLFQFNYSTSAIKDEYQSSNMVYGNIKGLTEIIEYDTYKAGFRVPHPDIFLNAEESSFKFIADYSNSGIIDTISYFIDNSFSNKNNGKRKIMRKVSGSTDLLVGIANEFDIIYSDSAGLQIEKSQLATAAGRRLIKTISFKIVCESDWENNDSFQFIEWKKSISPKNINLKDW